MRDTCEERHNKLVVLARGECLKLTAVVESSSPVGLETRELEEEWLRTAYALGGLTLVYTCNGEWGLVSRLYLPLSFTFTGAPSRRAEAKSDRSILRAWAAASLKGGEALKLLEGPLVLPSGFAWSLGGPTRLAPAGFECLPPYAREG